MARISKELVKRHDGIADLTPRHVIVVRVASFAFRFETVEQLGECLEYYEKKNAPEQPNSGKGLSRRAWGKLESTPGMGRRALV
jgi:hypothetical protein